MIDRDRYRLVREVREYLFRPDTTPKSLGYWCGLTGVAATSLMVLIALWNPSIMRSRLWALPPCLILAGLGTELFEPKTKRF